MSRPQTITSLVEFTIPLDELRRALAELAWDWDGPPVAILKPAHIAAVLKRYKRGELTARDVEDWANLVECREDIDFDASRAGDIADAIFDIANPEMQGRLNDIVDDLLAQLEG